MKTSIVAVIAASLFLIAALVGLGGGHGSAPGPPEMIVVSAPSSALKNSPSRALPATPTPTAASPAGQPLVVAVGRAVQQQNLQDILASRGQGQGTLPNGALQEAAGQPTPSGSQQYSAQVNTSVVPGPPQLFTPAPHPTPVSTGRPNNPSPRPKPKPKPSPSPAPPPLTPSPTPSPSPTTSPSVTATVTPPVTSTATPRP
jgi:hypothetical protein